MSLSTAFLDELRARTVLSAIIVPNVKLIRAGREWKACCPFHNEKTPSFTVNDDKGFYHCFGCGAHGDAIRFLTDQRGMPFMDAVKELAAKAGMEVPAPDPKAKERADRAASLTDVMASVATWYSEQLSGPAGAEARDYLKRRGIDGDTIQRFGLGFAPDSRSALKRALETLGEDKLVETGMLIQKGLSPDGDCPPGAGETYDRFRGRLMFPIRDPRGRVIGFGGRILGPGEPKYLNSPDTPLFDKGRTLYNIDRASPASRTAKRLIVVEGYMDVIALDRAGISEVVAPNGTAVTEAQLERMWRLDPSPILCFDGDSAGQKAAVRVTARALPLITPERTLRIVTLPAGQDPDDIIAAGGRSLFEKLLSIADPLTEFLWQSEVKNHDVSQPEGRARLKEALQTQAGSIKHHTLRREFERALDSRWWDAFRFSKQAVDKIRKSLTESRLSKAPNARYVLERAVLLGLSRYPQLVHQHEELVIELDLSTRKLATWRDVLIDEIRAKPHLDEDALWTILQSSEASPIEKRDIQKDLRFSFFRRMADADTAKRELIQVITVLVAEAKIDAALKEANRQFAESFDEADFARQNELHKRQSELKEQMAEFRESLAA
jgi:DNA primase